MEKESTKIHQILSMKGGLGDDSYAKNSKPQVSSNFSFSFSCCVICQQSYAALSHACKIAWNSFGASLKNKYNKITHLRIWNFFVDEFVCMHGIFLFKIAKSQVIQVWTLWSRPLIDKSHSDPISYCHALQFFYPRFKNLDKRCTIIYAPARAKFI